MSVDRVGRDFVQGQPSFKLGDIPEEHLSVNKTYLLLRGWTRAAIKQVLGEPDWLDPFSQYRPEACYDRGRVMAAEKAGLIRLRRVASKYREEYDPILDSRVGEEIEVHCQYCRCAFGYTRSNGRPKKYCSKNCRNKASIARRSKSPHDPIGRSEPILATPTAAKSPPCDHNVISEGQIKRSVVRANGTPLLPPLKVPKRTKV